MKHKGMRNKMLELGQQARHLRVKIDDECVHKETGAPFHLTVEISNISYEYEKIIKLLLNEKSH